MILAYSGATGSVAREILRKGFHLTVGEADATAASIAAPVFSARSGVIGALSLAVPASEQATDELLRHADAVVRGALRLSQTLAATRFGPSEAPHLQTHWHP